MTEEQKLIRKEAGLWLDNFLAKNKIKKEELLENVCKQNPYATDYKTINTNVVIQGCVAVTSKFTKELQEENKVLREKLKEITDYFENEIPHDRDFMNHEYMLLNGSMIRTIKNVLWNGAESNN